MTTRTYNYTLDEGNWSASLTGLQNIITANGYLWDSNTGPRLINLSQSGSKWWLNTMLLSGDGKVWIYDDGTTSDYYGTINYLQMGWGSGTNTVTLVNSNIQNYFGSGGSDILNFGSTGWTNYINTSGGDDFVTLGAGGASTVDLGGGQNIITTGSGGVGQIISSGRTFVNLGSGDVATIQLNSQSNQNITTAEGWVGTITTGKGNDVLIVGSGENDEGWAVDNINLGNGNNILTVATGTVGAVTMYSGNDVVTLGDGSVSKSAGVSWGGWTADSVDVGSGDNTITTGDGGVGQLTAGGGNDTVTTGSGSNSNGWAVNGINLGGGEEQHHDGRRRYFVHHHLWRRRHRGHGLRRCQSVGHRCRQRQPWQRQ